MRELPIAVFMPRNRNKYRRQSLTEVRVNGQDIRVSPHLTQYASDGKGEAEHVRQMTEVLVVSSPDPELADDFIALNEGRNPLAAAIRAKQPSTNSNTSLSTNATPNKALGDLASDGEAPRHSSIDSASSEA